MQRVRFIDKPMRELKNILRGLGLKIPSQKKSTAKNKNSLDFIHLINNWKNVVGKSMSKHTLPLKLIDKKLIILVNHPAIAEQLRGMQRSLLLKILKAYPSMRKEIEGLGFKTNPTVFAKQSKSVQPVQTTKAKPAKKGPHRFSPEYQRIAAEAQEIAKDIEDPELKELMTSLAMQNPQDESARS